MQTINQATKHPRKKKNCGHHQNALNRKVRTKKNEGWSKEGAESHNKHCHSISKLWGKAADDGVQTGAEQEHVDAKDKIEAWCMDKKKKGSPNKKKRKAHVFEPPELAGEDEDGIKFW